MTDRTFEVEGATLAYSSVGEGPTVVVAHGLSASREVEREGKLALWDELADAGFRVVSYDARGHGRSTGRPVPEDYLWPNLATDLLALVDDLSPEEPVYAIGTSMGTATIIHALTRRPERFRAVALAAPPTAWETRVAQGAMYEQTAVAAESLPAEEFAALAASTPPPPIFADVWVPGPPTLDPALLPSVFRGAGKSDMPDAGLVAQIDVPALLLAWATDPGHPVSTTERLSELLRDSEAVVAEDVEQVRTWPARAAAFFATHR
ncbi:alpha/beta fold hydrolase [Microbacterium sp.]|uniref:alpha/beta fold hydrolase n=1 Tax=Microbacterium sp. TaxID=51671 RepID=UPI00333FAF80